MTYIEFVQGYIKDQPEGSPIYTDKIADALADHYGLEKKKAAAAAAVAVKRIMDGEIVPDLRFFQKGIYYRTTATPSGETGIYKEQLIANRYLANDNGYETGPGLLHNLGLTSQIPNERIIATNSIKDCLRHDDKLGVSICPPKTRINAENKAYLQLLDALDIMESAPIDAENPYGILAEHVRTSGLQYERLLYYADNFYNRRTIINLAHTAGHADNSQEGE
jgi:hypothetical protein